MDDIPLTQPEDAVQVVVTVKEEVYEPSLIQNKMESNPNGAPIFIVKKEGLAPEALFSAACDEITTHMVAAEENETIKVRRGPKRKFTQCGYTICGLHFMSELTLSHLGFNKYKDFPI